MKKKTIFAVCLVLIFITIYFIGDLIGLKLYKLNYYDVSKIKNFETYSTGLTVKETLSIENKKLEDDEYLIYDNLKIKNDFKNFKKEENSYTLVDNNINKTYEFKITKEISYLDLMGLEILVFNSDTIHYDKINIEKYLKRNKITDDKELIQNIVDTKDKKYNIFSDIYNVKSNYAIHSFMSSLFYNMDNITALTGSIDGYIFNYEDIKEVNIYSSDSRYILTFIGDDYFTDEKIIELLETIVIEK